MTDEWICGFPLWTLCLFGLSSQTGPDYGQGMNPISRLAQIQQAKKEKEPEYVLLSERGMPRRREFIMQVKSVVFLSSFAYALNTNKLVL